jgi:hypothetical protein
MKYEMAGGLDEKKFNDFRREVRENETLFVPT